MGWRERLKPASFRGVSFYAPGRGGEGGRRLVMNEYPDRDDPWVEDLGRRGRIYRFDGYVIGKDFDKARDALIEACEKKGEATLVHPTYGSLTVQCERYSWSEADEEGGMCRFSFSFFESGANNYPSAEVDTVANVSSVVGSAYSDFETAFSDVFEVVNVPAFILQTAADQLSDLVALISGLRQGPIDALLTLNTARSTIARILGDVFDDPATFVLGSLPEIVRKVVSGFSAASSDSSVAMAGLRQICDYGNSLAPDDSSTAARAIEAQNTVALGALIARTALAEQALVAASMSFDAYDDAAALRTRLTGDIGAAATVAGDSGDGTGFQALKKLSRSVSLDLTARGASLARIVTYRRNVSLPAVVLAHQLYGDASRGVDLVARNKVPFGLFMPAEGSALSS